MAQNIFRENALRVVAVLGLLAILLLGAWGIIQVAFYISSLFNNNDSTSQEPTVRETMTISLPQTAQSNSPVSVGWGHQGGTGRYSYALSYSCVDGLTVKAPTPSGAMQSVNCNTPFNYTNATQSLSITPVYSGSQDAKVTITVAATNLETNAVTAQAQGSLTVLGKKPATSAPSTSTKKPSTSSSSTRTSGTRYVASQRTTQLFGYPDLSVRITSATSVRGTATVQFVVENTGTNVTPANWSFVAYLPIQTPQYPSGPQRALYPGDKIVYTLTYSDSVYGASYPYYNNGYTYGTCNMYGPCAVPGYQGGYQPYDPYRQNQYGYYYNYGNYGGPTQKSVAITVDPYNQVLESTKANNTASQTYLSY